MPRVRQAYVRTDCWSAEITVLLELLHHPLKIPLTWGRVDRCRLQPLMAQERGYAHQVSLRIQRVLAEAVAEGVGGDILKASQATILGHQQLDRPRADPLPALTDEQVIV